MEVENVGNAVGLQLPALGQVTPDVVRIVRFVIVLQQPVVDAGDVFDLVGECVGMEDEVGEGVILHGNDPAVYAPSRGLGSSLGSDRRRRWRHRVPADGGAGIPGRRRGGRTGGGRPAAGCQRCQR